MSVPLSEPYAYGGPPSTKTIAYFCPDVTPKGTRNGKWTQPAIEGAAAVPAASSEPVGSPDLEASIMHGRQRDRLYVKVASGDANPVNRRVHPLLEQYPDLGLLYEYVARPHCGQYDAMDRAISSLTYRSPTGPKDPA